MTRKDRICTVVRFLLRLVTLIISRHGSKKAYIGWFHRRMPTPARSLDSSPWEKHLQTSFFFFYAILSCPCVLYGRVPWPGHCWNISWGWLAGGYYTNVKELNVFIRRGKHLCDVCATCRVRGNPMLASFPCIYPALTIQPQQYGRLT